MTAPLRLLQGDALTVLRTLPDASVQCCVTSPPYWGLRNYARCECAIETLPHPRGDGRANLNGADVGGSAHSRDPDPACPTCHGTGEVPGVAEAQIGMEPTPEAYVARLVEVFREVRRILRPDGTLWLNMGDSYAAGGRGAWLGYQEDMGEPLPPKKAPPGLKPKDLCMMPFRLAKALQEPYYTGAIKDERDRIWLAAMIEAEGCLFIHRRKEGQNNGQGYARKHDSFGPGLEVANTSREVVDRCLSIVGKGSICSQGPEQNKRRKQTIYRWNLRTTECRDVIREVYPHLVSASKRQQARLLIACPPSGEMAVKSWRSIKGLHRGTGAEIDAAPPPSLYEPGWYLRMDVVWSKLNPMPESVTDRPTKSHEYLFLLSKSPRYFYDEHGVREPCTEASRKSAIPYGGRKNAEGGSEFSGKQYYLTPERGRNLRSVWTIPTAPFPGSHFAVFPEALVEPCIRAGTSERGACPACGAPWARVMDEPPIHGPAGVNYKDDGAGRGKRSFKGGADHAAWKLLHPIRTTGWRPTCTCSAAAPVPCVVMDPFAGSGTVGVVALKEGRHFLGIELNPTYIEMARRRIEEGTRGAGKADIALRGQVQIGQFTEAAPP